MSEDIFKIWGERRRILLTDKVEIDLLYLKKDTFCSTHKYSKKSNKFVVIKGTVKIKTELGSQVITKNQSWTVISPTIHRFEALEDSIMIELAFVKNGKIDPMDIERIRQGGRKINYTEFTEDELREKGMLDL